MPTKKFFTVDDHVLGAGHVPLPVLADAYGTPAYIYSADAILHQIDRLRGALGPDILLAYACKANSNAAILALMASRGLGADVVSGGELQRALNAGIPASKIVFSGVGKTDDELGLAMHHGIYQINIESASELDRLIALNPARPVRVAFRLNPDVDANTHVKISTGHGDSKFGMPAAEIQALYARAAAHDFIKPVGLTVHIGSQLTGLGPYRAAFAKLAALARTLPQLETIDIGGGIGVVYAGEAPFDLDGYAALVRDLLAPLNLALIAEPGRFLVAGAGLLLTRITHIKTTPGRPIIIVDAGMNDLIRPALYDAIHKVQPVMPSPAVNTHDTVYDIAGPVCESSDIFATAHAMPAPARGDLLALMNAGAYGFSMAGNYNSRLLPVEIMVRGGDHAIIRDRQTFDDLVRGEHIPDWVGGAA